MPFNPKEYHVLNPSQDNAVRWSAAKAVARIAEYLPQSFVDDVLDSVLSLYEIHSVGIEDFRNLPSAAEGTWHGATLACAEMARRGLIHSSRLSDLLRWMSHVSVLYLRVESVLKEIDDV